MAQVKKYFLRIALELYYDYIISEGFVGMPSPSDPDAGSRFIRLNPAAYP
jgi:hypothetical protein